MRRVHEAVRRSLPAIAAAICLFGLALQASAQASASIRALSPGEEPADRGLEELERTTLEAINTERRALGLPPLALSSELCQLARAYSRDMVERRFFDHLDPDGSFVYNRTDRAGIKRWSNLGENIARNRGFKDPVQAAVREWMKSEGHRGNILDDRFKETGIGVWIAPDRTVYFTQIFMARAPETGKR